MNIEEMERFCRTIQSNIAPESKAPEADPLSTGRLLSAYTGLCIAHLDAGEPLMAQVNCEIARALVDGDIELLAEAIGEYSERHRRIVETRKIAATN